MSDEKNVILERVYTVPLEHAWISPIKKRTPRQLRILRSFIIKHMKADTVRISSEVNEKLWRRGIEGRTRKIRVKAIKDKENVVTVYLAEGE
ncbi:MAG: 50S ribosomal protein L31e [Candidatus Bathyarchaeota archaeon]